MMTFKYTLISVMITLECVKRYNMMENTPSMQRCENGFVPYLNFDIRDIYYLLLRMYYEQIPEQRYTYITLHLFV